MRIEVSENGELLLTEIFSGVLMRTREGNEISICMRDDTFEINIITYAGGWHRINMQDGTIRPMTAEGKRGD